MKKIYDVIHQNNIELYNTWLKYVLFSWQWWLQLILTIVPWIIWFIFRRKQSTDRILYSGLFTMLLSYVLDVAGMALGLWQYAYELLPITPSIAPWDLTLIPVAVMFTIQFNPFHLNRYVKAILFSAVASFIIEPLFSYIGFYKLIRWKFIYSFPITILIYIAADWLSRRTNFKEID
jgi:hypothetical protein